MFLGRSPLLSAVVVLLGVLATAVPSEAQSPSPSPSPSALARPFGFVVGGLSTSTVVHADTVCPATALVCPLGGGGGVLVGYGRRYRPRREWLVAYDLTVRNARNIFSSATLQQLRFDHRWVAWSMRSNFEAWFSVGAALAFYGERFLVTTLGPALGVGGGVQLHVSPFFSVGVNLRFEALRFLIPFDTGDGVLRANGGIATLTASGYLAATFRGE